MIKANLEANTLHLSGEGGKAYCAYCGKEIPPDVESEDYEMYTYYHCDCEDAKKEIALKERIEELAGKLRKAKNELEAMKDRIRYMAKPVITIVEKEERKRERKRQG